MHPEGGYKTQTVIQIANILSAFDAGNITLRQLRIYFGCLVIVAAREAAKRSRTSEKRRGEVIPRYLSKELSKLTGCPISRVRGELRALEKAGLLKFTEPEITFTELPLPGSHELMNALSGGRSPARPIPLPRPLLRYICKCKKVAQVKTILAYLVRGLSLSRKGEITGKGTVKCSWIAETMGISLRAVKSARAVLLQMGLITDDEGSKQWKLNRHGAYFSINLSWKEPKKVIQEESKQEDLQQPQSQVLPVDNSKVPCQSFAPPQGQNCHSFAPPYKDKKTPYGSKNQKTQPDRLNRSGVCKTTTRKEKQEKPNINDVKVYDLESFYRVEELYFQAVKKGFINSSEASAINFLAAAVRAKTVPGDTPRIFIGLIKKKLWHHITQADEDRALAALRKYREVNPSRFRCREEIRWQEAA